LYLYIVYIFQSIYKFTHTIKNNFFSKYQSSVRLIAGNPFILVHKKTSIFPKPGTQFFIATAFVSKDFNKRKSFSQFFFLSNTSHLSPLWTFFSFGIQQFFFLLLYFGRCSTKSLVYREVCTGTVGM
jgi:hypothetical protein